MALCLNGFLIHDRDSIYSSAVDDAVAAMGLRVLETPVRCPQANAFCERLIGTLRRECLDWLILLNERHLRSVLREWVAHYNHGRPHASLDPGIPGGALGTLTRQNGHRIPDGHRVIATPILAGLHHTNIVWNAWRGEPWERLQPPHIILADHRGQARRGRCWNQAVMRIICRLGT